VRCPTLLLWSTRDDLGDLYGDPAEVWRPWVEDLRAGTVESGHHMAEENPADLSRALIDFLG
jgi:haloacetate dehalogenase